MANTKRTSTSLTNHQIPSARKPSPEANLENLPSSSQSTRATSAANHTIPDSIPPSMSIQKHIFLASIGNPAPYANTLHSAGHMVLEALATHLNLRPFGSNASIKPGHSTSTTLPSTNLTLWKSPSAMNISGRPLSQAWKSYLSTLTPDTRPSAKLIIVHDELELPLGRIRIKHSGSAKGHNGLKSVIQSFGGKQDGFSRVGVGIGRPESREPGDVSAWVLRNARPNEVLAIRGVVDEVCRVLEIG